MALVNAPLLSFTASGAVATTQVYSKWKGRPYVRRYVIPADPNTAAQQAVRSVFTWLSGSWKIAPALVQAPWNAFAQGQVLTGRNAYMGKNTHALVDETDLTNFIGSPGAKGGLAASGVSLTPGSGSISGTITMPDPPPGWTVAAAVLMAVMDQDPSTDAEYATYAGSVDSSPYTIELDDLPAGDYQVRAWPVWTKPDGTSAYGPSINGTATVT